MMGEINPHAGYMTLVLSEVCLGGNDWFLWIPEEPSDSSVI